MFEQTLEIPLKNSKGEIVALCLIDESDHPKIAQFPWSLNRDGYASGGGFLLHRFLMNPPENLQIDHINRNKLDNRKQNLRYATRFQNAQNHSKRKGSTSQYVGVSFAKSYSKRPWRVQVHREYFGSFESELHAAYCYDKNARRMYGEFAHINGVEKPNNYKPAPIRKIEPKKQKVHSAEIIISRNENGIALLACTNTQGVLVDDDIYLKYAHCSCNLNEIGGYPRIYHNSKQKALHRIILNAGSQDIIIHIDSNKLNCQVVNLFLVNAQQNIPNGPKHKNTSSKYIGVFKSGTFFTVHFGKDRKQYYGGQYRDEKVAAWAADQLALQLYGKHARVNNIQLNGYRFHENRAITE